MGEKRRNHPQITQINADGEGKAGGENWRGWEGWDLRGGDGLARGLAGGLWGRFDGMKRGVGEGVISGGRG